MERSPDDSLRRLRRRLWWERGFFTLALLGVAGAWAYTLLFPSVWAVYVDGRPLVAMRDRKAILAVLEGVKARGGVDPTTVTFVQPVRVARADPARVEIVDAGTASARLEQTLERRAPRAVLFIDGIAAAALPAERDAREALSRVQAALAGPLDTIDAPPRFRERVEIRTEPAPEELWMDVPEAVELLEGDGDSAPLVTVITEGRTRQWATIPCPTVERPAPTMYVGKRIVKQAGRPGKARLTLRVRCENGRVVNREVIRRETVQAPQPRIVVYGAKPRPAPRSSRRRR